MENETYTLRIITTYLKSKGISFEHWSSNVGISFYEHGCRVKLNETYSLSIQTHTDVVGRSFAETALQNMETKRIVHDGTYGYDDVIRHDTPEKLFEHIDELFDLVKCPDITV